MAPSATAMHQFKPIHPSPANVFEGSEKKLDIRFSRSIPTPCVNRPEIEKHFATFPIPCLSSQSQIGLDSHPGLRSLTRSDVESILNAAACTILSVISNHHVDAYLLSESSLFVYDMHIMIKTCGTTRLLHALPVILNLASQKLGLTVARVQFSRVSYLFPHEQLSPHDSFQNEVEFLDSHLQTNGKSFQTPSANGSMWHFYVADFTAMFLHHPALYGQHHINNLTSNITPDRSMDNETMEIYMFDMDPSIMQRFMFHDRIDCIGTDRKRDGITQRTGIRNLIPDKAIVDAFNFEPCGYSMNALLSSSYCTIHISPEPQASYVSFEMSMKTDKIPQLIASIVKLFQPHYFKVALGRFGDSANIEATANNDVSWSLLEKLLRLQSFRQEQLMHVDEHPGVKLAVGSFALVKGDDLLGSVPPLLRTNWPEELGFNLRRVVKQCNAKFIGKGDFLNALSNNGALHLDGQSPRFFIDLGRIAENIRHVCSETYAEKVRLRYSVQCNSDKAILALLSHINIDLEITNRAELELVRSLGTPRARIVLVTPVMTTSIIAALETVGTVAIFGTPSEAVLLAIREANVNVEVRVGVDNIQELRSLLSAVLSVTDRITSIGIDFQTAKMACDLDEVKKILARVQDAILALPDYLHEEITVDIGDFFWHKFRDTTGNQNHVKQILGELKHTSPLGVDVSRLIVQNAVSLLLTVIGTRKRADVVPPSKSYSYHLNDGVYGALSTLIMDAKPTLSAPMPVGLRAMVCKDPGCNMSEFRVAKTVNDGLISCTLFGPTCDAIDMIWTGKLAKLETGDGVFFGDMGCYSVAGSSGFNGFGMKFDVTYVVSGSDGGTSM